MFPRMLWKSMAERKARSGIAVFAVAVAATTVSAVLHLGGDVRRRMTEEVRAYGPNLIVYPRGESKPLVVGGAQIGEASGGRTLSSAKEVKVLLPADAVEVWSGALSVGGEPCAGIALPWKETFALCPWWSVEGVIAKEEGCLLGIDLASKWNVKSGGTIAIDERPTSIVGVLTTGGAEDREVVLPLRAAAERPGWGVGAIWARVNGSAAEVEALAAKVERAAPDASARPVRQVSEAEGKVLDRVGILLLYICLSVLCASALCIATTMLAAGVDREREMALLLALGAGPRRIALLTLTQSALLGAVGGAAGHLIGWQVARFLGSEIFHASASLSWMPLGPALGASVLLCLLGSVVPLRRALSLAPAAVLKGE